MTLLFRTGTIAGARPHSLDAGSQTNASRAVLPLIDWLARAEDGSGAHETTGVVIDADTRPADLAALTDAPLIVVRLAKFTDGRAYSIARIMRETHGYTGELRVTGDVLLDQIALLQRAGFDSFEIAHLPTIDALARGHLPSIASCYQDLPHMPPAIRPTLRRAARSATANHSNERRP